MARETSQSAKAAERSAAATEVSATAAQASVAEIRRDREMEWRPHLSVGPPNILANLESFVAEVNNLGRGPALRCVCAVWANERALLTQVFDLAPNARERVHGEVNRASELNVIFLLDGEPQVSQRSVAICRDGLAGHWYRFTSASVAPDTWDGRTVLGPMWVEILRRAMPELGGQG
jgi:hypothetical protein